jgi:hypothetical protein
LASPHTSRLANASRSNRVQHRFVYGLVFRFRLLSTPHLDDAVTFGYGQASAPVRKGLSPFCWCVLSGALVDDDELLRDLFGGALRKKGYHVIEADSGVEGFEKAQKNLPDLILSDIWRGCFTPHFVVLCSPRGNPHVAKGDKPQISQMTQID